VTVPRLLTDAAQVRPADRRTVLNVRRFTMLVPEKFSPIRELDAMDRRMRRMFAGFPFPLALVPPLTPAADVYETDEEFVFELEVPGYEEKELVVEVADHTLMVKGARREETEEKDKTLRLHERLESTFERRFELPAVADREQLSAVYDKGLLTVHVPKTLEVQPRKVEIQTA
jgi:HSP20 family protein